MHAVREDVVCVLHIHTRAGVAVSAQRGHVLPMHVFETACQIQLATRAGGELIPMSQAIIRGIGEAMRVQTDGMGAQFVWPSLMRQLERSDPGYKH